MKDVARKLPTGDDRFHALKLSRRMNREFVSLAVFAARWFQTEDLRYTDTFRQQKCLDKLRELLGGPDGPGLLQDRMNREMDGILDRLMAEFPNLRWKDVLIFSHSAAGFTNDLSARLAGFGSPVSVSVVRSRLRERIGRSSSAHAQEYLALLPRKGCRFGEEMLYLHNLKYRTTWKQ